MNIVNRERKLKMKKLEKKPNLLTKKDVDKISREAFFENPEFETIKTEFKRLGKI